METKVRKKRLKYFIGMDVHQSTTSLCVLNGDGEVYDAQTLPTTELHLREYLRSLPSSKGLVMEEMDLAQWLYGILPQEVDEMKVCDPYRNHCLKEGAKNDRIDAKKLADLYRAGLIREVFHSTDKRIEVRPLVSCYRSTMKNYIRCVNQYKALLRKSGKRAEEFTGTQERILKIQEAQTELYASQLVDLQKEIKRQEKSFPEMGYLKSVPGIGAIGAIKLLATVVDPCRFPTKHHFWSYCGLVKHPRESGGKSYGKKKARANLEMKSVMKTAALTSLKGEGPMKQHFLAYAAKGLNERQARHAVGS